MEEQNDAQATSSKGTKREWFELDEEHNSYVFVWGLPLDIKEEEFVDLMKKYGVIKKKPEKGNPFNVKLYKNKSTGQPKGEGLCCYARMESVNLALEYLEGLVLIHNDTEYIIHCKRAEFQLKGDYDPSKKPRPLEKKVKQRQKKRIDKLLTWDEPDKVVRIKKVILKNMFVPQDLEDPEALLLLKEDVEERCTESECGIPQKIDICEKNPEGIVEITFKDPDLAQKCVDLMDSQYYACRKVSAELWDGRTKYRIKETEEEVKKRHAKFQHDIQLSDSDSDDDKRNDNEDKESSLSK